MLEGPLGQVGGYTGVKRPVTLASHDVHTGLLHRFFLEPLHVIASEAKQSILSFRGAMDCFVATLLAMTEVKPQLTILTGSERIPRMKFE